MYVAKNEGINAAEEALHIIGQKADGALRDALSIFDQIVSLSGKTITYKDVIEILMCSIMSIILRPLMVP